MWRRSWWLGTLVGLTAGSLVSLPATFLDWRLNPGGIFHSQSGTDWVVVTETFVSWFVPVALVALVITVAVHSWITRDQKR